MTSTPPPPSGAAEGRFAPPPGGRRGPPTPTDVVDDDDDDEQRLGHSGLLTPSSVHEGGQSLQPYSHQHLLPRALDSGSTGGGSSRGGSRKDGRGAASPLSVVGMGFDPHGATAPPSGVATPLYTQGANSPVHLGSTGRPSHGMSDDDAAAAAAAMTQPTHSTTEPMPMAALPPPSSDQGDESPLPTSDHNFTFASAADSAPGTPQTGAYPAAAAPTAVPPDSFASLFTTPYVPPGAVAPAPQRPGEATARNLHQHEHDQLGDGTPDSPRPLPHNAARRPTVSPPMSQLQQSQLAAGAREAVEDGPTTTLVLPPGRHADDAQRTTNAGAGADDDNESLGMIDVVSEGGGSLGNSRTVSLHGGHHPATRAPSGNPLPVLDAGPQPGIVVTGADGGLHTASLHRLGRSDSVAHAAQTAHPADADAGTAAPTALPSQASPAAAPASVESPPLTSRAESGILASSDGGGGRTAGGGTPSSLQGGPGSTPSAPPPLPPPRNSSSHGLGSRSRLGSGVSFAGSDVASDGNVSDSATGGAMGLQPLRRSAAAEARELRREDRRRRKQSRFVIPRITVEPSTPLQSSSGVAGDGSAASAEALDAVRRFDPANGMRRPGAEFVRFARDFRDDLDGGRRSHADDDEHAGASSPDAAGALDGGDNDFAASASLVRMLHFERAVAARAEHDRHILHNSFGRRPDEGGSSSAAAGGEPHHHHASDEAAEVLDEEIEARANAMSAAERRRAPAVASALRESLTWRTSAAVAAGGGHRPKHAPPVTNAMPFVPSFGKAHTAGAGGSWTNRRDGADPSAAQQQTFGPAAVGGGSFASTDASGASFTNLSMASGADGIPGVVRSPGLLGADIAIAGTPSSHPIQPPLTVPSRRNSLVHADDHAATTTSDTTTPQMTPPIDREGDAAAALPDDLAPEQRRIAAPRKAMLVTPFAASVLPSLAARAVQGTPVADAHFATTAGAAPITVECTRWCFPLLPELNGQQQQQRAVGMQARHPLLPAAFVAAASITLLHSSASPVTGSPSRDRSRPASARPPSDGEGTTTSPNRPSSGSDDAMMPLFTLISTASAPLASAQGIPRRQRGQSVQGRSRSEGGAESSSRPAAAVQSSLTTTTDTVRSADLLAVAGSTTPGALIPPPNSARTLHMAYTRPSTSISSGAENGAVLVVVRLVLESPVLATAVLRLLNHRRCCDDGGGVSAAASWNTDGGVLAPHRQDTCALRFAVSHVLSTLNGPASVSSASSCAQQLLHDESIAGMAATHRATAMMRSN